MFRQFRFLIALVVSCGCSLESSQNSSDSSDIGDVVDSVEPLIAVRPLDPEWSDQEALVIANNDFAFDLYARLCRQRGNLVWSPYNVSLGLAMCYAGAREGTQSQLRDALRIPLDQARVPDAWGELARSVSASASRQDIDLHVANRLWADNSVTVQPEFLRIIGEGFGADVERLDLRRNQVEAARHINAWIREQTHGKLQDSFSSAGFPDNTLMALTGAMYFNAKWSYPFRMARNRLDQSPVSRFKLYYQESDFAVVDRVSEVARRRGISNAQVALAWLLEQPGVTAPIIGASKMEHLESAAAALELQLSSEELTGLGEPYRSHPVLGHR